MDINPPPRTRRRLSDDHRARVAAVLDRHTLVANERDCWLWAGSRLPSGYGTVKYTVAGKAHTISAHRAAFERANGYLPRVVRHTCDNPPCCNPRHLQGGTQKDNLRDMFERGRARHVRGSDHVRAKLTEEDVRAIRASPDKHAEIAAQFGVDTSTVTRIKAGEAWKHVSGELPPRRGRASRGELNGRAKLTFEIVAEIRAAEGRQVDIAKRFGISQARVSAIKTGRQWK